MKPAMMVAKLQHSGIICASDVRRAREQVLSASTKRKFLIWFHSHIRKYK